jgi:type IV pilus assembly protein PilQ
MKHTKKLIVVIMSTFLSLTVNADTDSEQPRQPISYLTLKTHHGRLSFYFQNIEVRALLQLIAKNSGLNFIISDTVKGNITLNLQNVTWQQAFNVVLKSHGLTSRRTGNVIYVSTLDDITTNEAKQLQADQAISNLKPLRSTILHLRYANAADIAAILKGAQSNLLTSRGEVAVDARTNSLIIRDISTNLFDLEREIRVLDIPARQVLIEARIVNIDSTYEETLGVRFGVSTSRHLSGTFFGANNINKGISPSNLIDPLQRLNFNVPAHQLFDGTNPGSIALALAHLGPALLDLELSALEGENHAKVIARPRVITSNQKKAIIQTGQEIPYQEATSSGATSVTFKNAVLSMEITPQITPNNKIILTIKANEDTQGPSITTGTSSTTGPTVIPIINTESVESNVLLNDQETIVLGGIYRQNKVNTLDRVPFFGSIPLIGYLFSNRGVHDERHELLIFITPKIIHPLLETRSYGYKDE